MTWFLIIWLAGDPHATGVIEQVDEASCIKTMEAWEAISPDHHGYCAYGNIIDWNLETYLNEKD